MNLNYTRLLFRITTTLIRYDEKIRFNYFVTRSIPNSVSLRSRFSSNNSKDLYAILDDDDFEGEKAFHYTNTNLEAIAEGNPETLRLLKVCQLEIALIAEENHEVPNKITENQWRDLLALSSKSERVLYLYRLWRKEYLMIEKRRIQAEKREKLQKLRSKNLIKRVQSSTNLPVNYGPSGPTLFQRFSAAGLKNLYNFRLLQTMMFGPHIIVDCSFDKCMSRKDIVLCVKQIITMWSMNRKHLHPFDIIFCNLNTNSNLYLKLLDVFPAIEEDPTCPFNFTDKNYLDLYPKEQLVYLTPYAPDILERYDHNSIYIIGGVVDKCKEEPFSFAKAKKDGLQMAKFPVDKYLNWGAGKRNLTIDQCLGIMIDLKDGGSWRKAFRHIPRDKLAPFKASLNDENDETKTDVKPLGYFENQSQQKFLYETLLGMGKKSRKS